MDVNIVDKKTRNKKLFLPFVIAFAGALLMAISVFLPYGAASKENAENLKEYSDEVVYEELNMKAKDLLNISMVEYARVYCEMSEQIFGSKAFGIFYVTLVSMIGGFSLLALLFAALKKAIPCIIFSILAFGTFLVQNKDFSMRGVIPSDDYVWGAAYYVFILAFVMALAGSIWLFVKKIRIKKESREMTAET